MKTKKMPNKRRLVRLAKILKALPPKRFNYQHWAGVDWAGAKNLSCGTTACALGWATTVPGWGLELRRARDRYGAHVFVGVRGRKRRHDPTDESFKSGEAAFGLTAAESEYLFRDSETAPYFGLPASPKPNAKPREVAEHILRFVKFTEKNRKTLLEARTG